MQQQEVPANEMTCSAAISACEDSSWRWALELFEEMLMERLEADIDPGICQTHPKTSLNLLPTKTVFFSQEFLVETC